MEKPEKSALNLLSENESQGTIGAKASETALNLVPAAEDRPAAENRAAAEDRPAPVATKAAVAKAVKDAAPAGASAEKVRAAAPAASREAAEEKKNLPAVTSSGRKRRKRVSSIYEALSPDEMEKGEELDLPIPEEHMRGNPAMSKPSLAETVVERVETLAGAAKEGTVKTAKAVKDWSVEKYTDIKKYGITGERRTQAEKKEAIEKGKLRKKEITMKLNRLRRLAYRYRYPLMAVCAAVLILIGGATVRAISAKRKADALAKRTTAITGNSGYVSIDTDIQANGVTASPAGAVKKGTIYSINRPAEVITSSSKGSFVNSCFIGDETFIKGVGLYGYCDSARVFTSAGLKTDNAAIYAKQVSDLKPDKVFIMLGYNDLAEGRSNQNVLDNMKILIQSIRSQCDVKIFIVSVIPETAGFEGSSAAKQSAIDALNGAYATSITATGASFIDLTSSIKGADGYLNEACSANGNNIKSDYYPFLMDGIAKLIGA